MNYLRMQSKTKILKEIKNIKEIINLMIFSQEELIKHLVYSIWLQQFIQVLKIKAIGYPLYKIELLNIWVCYI